MSERKARKGRAQKVSRQWLVSATSRRLLCCLPFPHSKAHSEVTALASGDSVKLKTLARKYRIAHTYSYEQYADCLASRAIDAVYIALPNHTCLRGCSRSGGSIFCAKNPWHSTKSNAKR
jgi:hypothetical protein